MLDENEAIEGGNEQEIDQIDVGEGEGQQDQAPDPYVDLARRAGWVPKEEFAGAEDKWSDARSFIERRLDGHKGLKRDLRDVRSQLERVARTSADLAAQQVAERDAYWQQQFNQAVEAGDTRAADHAVQQRMMIQQQTPRNAPPEVDAFVSRNAGWYNQNPAATHYAQAQWGLYQGQGLSLSDVAERVEADVSRAYPGLIAGVQKPTPKPPAQVAQQQTRMAAAPNRKKGFADMPADARKAAIDFEERRGIPRDKYAETYWRNAE